MSVASINGAETAATSAAAATSVNINVLVATQNLSEDLVDRLLPSLGVGGNFSGHA